MSSALWLRVASVVSFLFAAGHTLGGRKSWSFTGEKEVLEPMRTFKVEAFGVSRSYMDFYRGFGFTLSVYLLLQAVVLWQMAPLTQIDPAHVRPIIVSFLIASIASGALTWKFIFPVPVYFGAVVTVCLIAALIVA